MISLIGSLSAPVSVSYAAPKQEIVHQNQQTNHSKAVSMPNLSFGYNGISINENQDVVIKINTPMNMKNYQLLGRNAVKDVDSRIGKEGQVLDWVNKLPQSQLKNLDSIYNLAQDAKKGGYTDLVILGMGGSRYPTQTAATLLSKDSKLHFYSGVDPQSFKRFADKLDLDKTKFLIVSKSGGTLETTTAYQSARKLMQEHLKKEDVSDRFIAMTNKSPEKSKLRKQVDAGEVKYSGLVHDEISGGYSMFDDATLFTLAYAGLEKADAERMLKASLKAQKEFLNPDITKNTALQLAAFNVNSKSQGQDKQFVEYFDDAFEGAAMWEKQLKNEGLKSKISTDTNIGPAFLHYITEADLDDSNRNSFYTFVSVKSSDKTSSALLNGAIKAYSAQHPVSMIELKDLSPESVARFVELKHFETLYTGNMLRQQAGDVTPADKALPEVTQTNVNKYKNEVKKVLDY